MKSQIWWDERQCRLARAALQKVINGLDAVPSNSLNSNMARFGARLARREVADLLDTIPDPDQKEAANVE